MVITPLTFVLFSAWPVAIGTVSLFYCGECLGIPSPSGILSHLSPVMNVHFFYKCDRRFRQLMSSTHLTRSRYIRLMVISATEIIGTIPLGTVYIVKTVKLGVGPWRGWTFTHEDYSAVYQIPASVWKNDSYDVFALEMFRWSLVLCAFLFFALFGFANEARQHYHRVYTTIASRIGYSTSILFRSSQAYVQLFIHCVTLSVSL
jgi:pheromone a factor receptor